MKRTFSFALVISFFLLTFVGFANAGTKYLDEFLETAKTNKCQVVIFTTDGLKFSGSLVSYDDEIIKINDAVVIFKHSIVYIETAMCSN